MPHLIVTRNAASGIERCLLFLDAHDSAVAGRAASIILRKLRLLERQPLMGRPVSRRPDLREVVIGFGSSGYVALYRYEPDKDAVYILALRHQREAGY